MKYRSRKSKLRRRAILIAIAVLLVVLLICLYFNATDLLVSTAEARLRARVVTAVNEAVMETLSDGVRYSDLVCVERGTDGDIQALTANSAEINRIARETASRAQALLQEMSEAGIGIPLGAFIGIEAWAGFGPEIVMQIIPVATVTCKFTSGFETAGINQTRHSVYLQIDAEMIVVLPAKTRSFVSSSQVLIAESVLVGDVPNVYLQGNIFGNGYTSPTVSRAPRLSL